MGILETNTPEPFGVVLLGVETLKDDGLIGSKARAFVDRMRIQSSEPGIALCPYHKEFHGLVHPVQSMAIQVPSIHDSGGSGFYWKLIENFDVVYFPMCDEDYTGDIAPKIQECVHLYDAMWAI